MRHNQTAYYNPQHDLCALTLNWKIKRKETQRVKEMFQLRSSANIYSASELYLSTELEEMYSVTSTSATRSPMSAKP